jgi:hypothetical protein
VLHVLVVEALDQVLPGETQRSLVEAENFPRSVLIVGAEAECDLGSILRISFGRKLRKKLNQGRP